MMSGVRLEDDVLTVREAAAIFKVTPRTIHRLVKAGKLPVNRDVCGHPRFSRRDLETLWESRRKRQ
jgi:excisionase family DNA binding protein